jgi:hypothetical protein
MIEDSKEFLNLLEQVINEKTFDLELLNGQTVKCKQLSMAQLKELIKTLTDSPLTQALFNSASTKIFKESIIDLPENYKLTIVDRLLFLIETRRASIYPTVTLTDNNNNLSVTVDLKDFKENLISKINENKSNFETTTFKTDKITYVIGTPSLDTEEQLNEEIYSKLDIKPENTEEFKNFIADSFIYEIAKYLFSITLNEETTLELSQKTFKERVEILEKLPAHAIQTVISYIEKQKAIIDENMIVDGIYVPLDSSFFTIY